MPETFAPIDFTQPVGQVRLLANDFDLNNPWFPDEAYAAMLNLNDQSVRLAAAQALDIMSVNEIIVQKRIKMLDLLTDGPAEAAALKAQAKELRRQEYEGDGDMTGFFDYAEMVYDAFTARQRAVSQWLRQGI